MEIRTLIEDIGIRYSCQLSAMFNRETNEQEHNYHCKPHHDMRVEGCMEKWQHFTHSIIEALAGMIRCFLQ